MNKINQLKQFYKRYEQYIPGKVILAGIVYITYSTTMILNEIQYKKNNEEYKDISKLLLEERIIKRELKKARIFTLNSLYDAQIKKETLEERANSVTKKLKNHSTKVSETRKRNNDFLKKGFLAQGYLLGYLINGVIEQSYLFYKKNKKD